MLAVSRASTREVVQVTFKTHKDRRRPVLGNHWPSRSGAQFESAGYRGIADGTLGYCHHRVLEVHGSATPVLARPAAPLAGARIARIQSTAIQRQR